MSIEFLLHFLNEFYIFDLRGTHFLNRRQNFLNSTLRVVSHYIIYFWPTIEKSLLFFNMQCDENGIVAFKKWCKPYKKLRVSEKSIEFFNSKSGTEFNALTKSGKKLNDIQKLNALTKNNFNFALHSNKLRENRNDRNSRFYISLFVA